MSDQAQTVVDKRIGQFIEVRDKIKEIEERHEKELKPFVDMKNKLQEWLLSNLDTTGATSIKTKLGTCYASVRYTASLADPDTFMKFVIENQRYELLDRRANATAAKDYAEENGGALPPGVNLSAIKTVGVRRPSSKAAD